MRLPGDRASLAFSRRGGEGVVPVPTGHAYVLIVRRDCVFRMAP